MFDDSGIFAKRGGGFVRLSSSDGPRCPGQCDDHKARPDLHKRRRLFVVLSTSRISCLHPARSLTQGFVYMRNHTIDEIVRSEVRFRVAAPTASSECVTAAHKTFQPQEQVFANSFSLLTDQYRTRHYHIQSLKSLQSLTFRQQRSSPAFIPCRLK